MKKKLILSLGVASCLMALEPELEQVKNDLENNSGLKNFNTKVIDVKKITEAEGWYSVMGMQETQQGQKTFNFTTNKKVIIFGNAYNIDSGENLGIKINFEQFKKDANYTIGNGKEEYFLITDPECPYCKQLEEILPLMKEKAKIYVFLTADIIPTHWLAKGSIDYINSLPIEKRESESRKIFMEKDNAEIIKKIDKYNISFYSNLKEYLDKKEAKRLVDMYFASIEKAFGIELKENEKRLKFLNKKIEDAGKTDLKKAEEIYKNTKNIISTYFGINGTPTIIEVKTGKKLDNQYEMFIKNNVLNMKQIKEIASNSDYVIRGGKKGKKKVYYFVGTKCGACIEEFKDEKKLNNLLENNEVTFMLSTDGEQQLKEAKYILSIKDEKERFEKFKKIMLGEKIEGEAITKNYDVDFEKKIDMYQFDMYKTLVIQTPTIIDENGKEIR